jgi:hypothetical protein
MSERLVIYVVSFIATKRVESFATAWRDETRFATSLLVLPEKLTEDELDYAIRKVLRGEHGIDETYDTRIHYTPVDQKTITKVFESWKPCTFSP